MSKAADMLKALPEEKLFSLRECDSMDSLDFSGFSSYIVGETQIGDFRPEPVVQIDPRSNERIVYNSKRAKRPHDNRGAHVTASPTVNTDGSDCVICQGKSTRILDIQKLSGQGTHTFINKNLFPVLYPVASDQTAPLEFPADPMASVDGWPVSGMHFLQWTSNEHSKDFFNLPVDDSLIAVQALARLEKALLHSKGPYLPNRSWSGDENDDTSGFVSIIKNYGRLVGGSLEHGHQQIAYTGIMPGKFRNNLSFYKDKGILYSEYMLKENPKELTLWELETGRLIIPYYMRRPGDMQFIFHDTKKRYLHELTSAELQDLALVLGRSTAAIMDFMPAMGRETAYNFVVHNGPGAGVYVEFLPYTQEYGGYEHAGIYLCQGWPQKVAQDLKRYFD